MEQKQNKGNVIILLLLKGGVFVVVTLVMVLLFLFVGSRAGSSDTLKLFSAGCIVLPGFMAVGWFNRLVAQIRLQKYSVTLVPGDEHLDPEHNEKEVGETDV